MKTELQHTLCGGTFFVLLLRARKQRIAARQKAAGGRDGLSDQDVFEGLIKVAFPNFQSPLRSFKTYTSNYKACRISTNEYLPFGDEELISNFDATVRGDYLKASARMSDFIRTYISEKDYSNWLVKALFELIAADTSIRNELFYVSGSANPLSKERLLSLSEVELSSFLLGIWHFIIVNRHNNRVGEATLSSWHKKPDVYRAKHEFISDIGHNWPNRIRITHVVTTPEPTTPSASSDPDEDECAEIFLTSVKEKYHKMKTILYNQVPREFYEFYIPLSMSRLVRVQNNIYKNEVIADISVEKLKQCSNHIIVSGPGGSGKTMLMRHLLLDAVDNHTKLGLIPIPLRLKNYSGHIGTLSFLQERIGTLCSRCNLIADTNKMEEFLITGRFLFLLDGVDEIKPEYKKRFMQEMELIVDKYPDNMYVVTSRPTESFVAFHRFTKMNMCPFTKDQAMMLLDRLEFRPERPQIKEHFIKEVDDVLYSFCKSFCENPLLLTIMLMTYEEFADLPTIMCSFHRQAYETMIRCHDETKGAFERILKTGLSAVQFVDFFTEFCARTYCDGKNEITEFEFYDYFNNLNERNKVPDSIVAPDFIYDVEYNLCLMNFVNGKYRFAHSSYQEYFCALYFAKQKEKHLGSVGKLFENKKTRTATDVTFDMLYKMIPEKIDKYVIKPYLERLFKQCEEGEGLITFIKNAQESFIYNFLATKEKISGFSMEEQYSKAVEYFEDLKSRFETPSMNLFDLFA